jgi:arsenate reductase
MSVHLYGIPNCSTVRAAREWLSAQGVDYQFHDFKKEGAALPKLQQWQEALGWETVLNRRGLTWRGLPAERRLRVVDAGAAALLMGAHVSLIKRPILEARGKVLAGFAEEDYRALLG